MKGLQPSCESSVAHGPSKEGVPELWHPWGAFLPAGIMAQLPLLSKAKGREGDSKSVKAGRHVLTAAGDCGAAADISSECQIEILCMCVCA